MKILIFGRGVIATQYGWALEKAGNIVEFYVRPGRSKKYGTKVKLDIRDGRTNSKEKRVQSQWPVVLREELNNDHNYDLIIVSINHNQVSEAVKFLAPRVGGATVLFFNNFWVNPQKAVAPIPLDKIVWGFPGGGGGLEADGTLAGGFMKGVTFGTFKTELTERELVVRKLFKDANFSISEKKDFSSWLRLHFILNAGLGEQAIKAGGYIKLMESPKELKEAILNIRELIPVVKAHGDKVGLGVRLLINLPAAVLGWVFHKAVFRIDSLPYYIMEKASNQSASNGGLELFYLDVLADARKLGIQLPRLEALLVRVKR